MGSEATSGPGKLSPLEAFEATETGPPQSDGPWLVRAFFSDREDLERVPAGSEVWAILPEKGYLLAEVDSVGWEVWRAAGFSLEIDPEGTEVLRQASSPRELSPEGGGIPGFACYRTVEETYAAAEAMVAAHPDLAAWIDIGDSWEKTDDPTQGFDLRVLVLTQSAVPGPKPKLLVLSAIHAREYATAELNTRFAEHLLAGYGADPDVTWILDHHELHLVLIANPDGRERAETGLLWRKNADNDFCTGSNDRGVDLNRNFEFQWGCCGGSSASACSTSFRGPSAGSEPETQALQDHMRAIFPDQRPADLTIPAPADATGVMLDVHSFGEDVLWSWGFTTTPPPNAAPLYSLGRKYAFFTGYRPQHGSLSTVDGATKDFAYGELGVPGYTIELGTAFFQDCASFESRILPDNLESLLYAAKIVRTPYVTPSGPDTIDPAFPPTPFTPGELVPLTAILDDTRYSTANGLEPTQDIAAGELYVDDPPWSAAAAAIPLSPGDGSFDGQTEAVTAILDTAGLAPGRHTVFVRGRDAAGGWGAVSAVFVHLIDPLTSPFIEGFVRDADTQASVAATVRIGGFEVLTDPVTGFYRLQVPSATYDLSADAPGYAPASIGRVVAGDSQTLLQDFFLQPLVAVFEDDVERGNAGWTANLPWAITQEASFSPLHSWTDSAGGAYGDGADTSLVSPLLDFSGLGSVTLTFRHIYDIEPGFDFGRVEVSIDGGLSWQQVAAFSDRDQNAAWLLEEIALPMLAEQPAAAVRFRLTSDGSLTEDGWHVDDIAVRAAGTGPVGGIFMDGFELGTVERWSSSVPADPPDP